MEGESPVGNAWVPLLLLVFANVLFVAILIGFEDLIFELGLVSVYGILWMLFNLVFIIVSAIITDGEGLTI